MKETLHIYTRVSTSVQEDDGTSLDTQRDLGIQRSENLGMEYKVWNEGSQSSSKDDLSNRPVLTELLQEVQDGNVQHLYVWNTDRLSRNLQTWGLIRLLLIRHDVHLHTPTGEQILSDPQTNLMLGIMSEFSNYDNLLRTERFRLGKLQKIKDGGWKGGPPPYGYKLDFGRLLVNEEEEEWVVKIHEWYRDGLTPDEIKTHLMENGVMTRRGNPVWSLGSITSLLNNTHYDGYWMFEDGKSGEVVRVKCPRICSPELILGVKKSKEKRSYKRGHKREKTSVSKHPYLVSKLMKCGNCGMFYYGNKKKTQTSYYHCGSKTNKYRDKGTDKYTECGTNRNLRLDTTEQVIWEEVKGVIGSSHLFKETIKREVLGDQKVFTETKKETEKTKKRIDRLEKEVEKITSSIVNLTTENILSESRDLKGVVKKLEEKRLETEVRISELTNELSEKEEENRWIDWLKEYKDRLNKLDDLTPQERQDFVRGVVSEIVVHELDNQQHKLEINFLFPYVGDRLVYKDETKKSLGYEIKGGRKRKNKVVNLLKKFTS
ncbi:MAG: recombinase family protein [Flavobacteriaceae bacterium]